MYTPLFPKMKFKKYRKLLVCATPHTAVKQMTQLPVKAFEQPSKIQSSHAVLSLPYSRCLLSPFTLTQAACFPLIKAKVFCLYPSSQVQTHSYSSSRSPVPAFKLTWVLSDFVVGSLPLRSSIIMFSHPYSCTVRLSAFLTHKESNVPYGTRQLVNLLILEDMVRNLSHSSGIQNHELIWRDKSRISGLYWF